MDKYWTGAHTTHRLKFHLVWIPKYRKRILHGNVSARLQELLRQGVEVNHWQLDELAIQPDHIHLLLQIKPSESIARVVQLLKGGTSKKIREEFPELEEFLWGDSFWADGYFAESVGVINESVIANYIKNQSSMPGEV